ncbi:MAG: hypothetical protein EOO41_05480 [Methanobacteriota archaeon]|nr:MAG: hypothetical protein EOO41_05480 [Euryarchaeota archaeon]
MLQGIEAMVKSGKLSLENYMSMVEGQAEKDKLALSRLAATGTRATLRASTCESTHARLLLTARTHV